MPTLWRLEVANRLTVAVRRRRIDAEFRRAALADLALRDITTDAHTDYHAWGETPTLADCFGLNVCMTPPTWSSHSGVPCRLPRSTRRSARRLRRLTCVCLGRFPPDLAHAALGDPQPVWARADIFSLFSINGSWPLWVK